MWYHVLAGEGAYPGGFIEHYLIALIYPDGMTRAMALILGVIALGPNLLSPQCVDRV